MHDKLKIDLINMTSGNQDILNKYLELLKNVDILSEGKI